MGGPSGHGQRNKPHKAGRTAGLSARQRARQGKEVGGGPGAGRAHPKALQQRGKEQRHQAAKQARDAKRQELLQRKRRGTGAPVVVAVLPLSEDADVGRLWHGLCAACERQQQGDAGADEDAAMDFDALLQPGAGPLQPRTLAAGGKARGVRLTLLPPPPARGDPLAIAELARCAEVLLLALPGGEAAGGAGAVDAAGEAALAVLRAVGLPSVVCCVVGAGGAGTAMKERSAGRKRAEKALEKHLAGEHRLLHADTPADLSALARHLAEHAPPTLPLWRQQRPAVMAEAADFNPDPASASGCGTLVLRGYVRGAPGLSANQAVTVPGAGDFRIAGIYGPPDPHAAAGSRRGPGPGEAMEAEAGSSSGLPPLLARPDPEAADHLVRENVPDPMANEQTWPTEEELEHAAQHSTATTRKRVPKGTSQYQAAWIMDEEDYEASDEDPEQDWEEMDMQQQQQQEAGAPGRQRRGGGGDALMEGDEEEQEEEAPELQPMDDDADTEYGDGDGAVAMEDDGDDEAYAAAVAEARRERDAARRSAGAEAEQLGYPDEVDVPLDTPARVRLQKYRGLKSLRSSAWDPKESLPQEYARVFAFEDFRRAHKRAREAAARADRDPSAVNNGSWVELHLADVPADAAARVVAHVAAAAEGRAVPLTLFGLMQHETKMSIVNFSIRKASGYAAPLASKEALLLFSGLRSYVARPILSTDDPGMDKHKMERFLHAGQHAVASVYAPIMYPPLPLLAFKLPAPQQQQQQQDGSASEPSEPCVPSPLQPGGSGAALAATGTLRGCDPDRIVLKRIMLTGAPVRVHKRRATVRFMFHHPDDVRWFKPVELATKGGRRGRITEPLGTHGAMKCIFDQGVAQHDTVCMPLYKRVFPKWPPGTSATDFAAR